MVESNQPVAVPADPGPPAATSAAATPPVAPPAPADPNRLRKRSLGIIAAIVIAISLAASAAVLISIKSSPSYPAGSPEATVMAWTDAVKAGDNNKADTYLSSRLLDSGMNSAVMMTGSASTSDFSIVSTSVTDSTATIGLSVSRGASGMTPGYTVRVRVSLVRELGSWKIDQIGS